MSNDMSQNLSDISDKASPFYFTAPVEMPSREQMKVKLVPLHLIKQLEEARSDERFWGSVFWTVLGAILGIIGNWATSDSTNITRPSLVLIAILTVVGILMYVGGIRKYKGRAEDIKVEITRAGINLPDNQLETLRKKSESLALTRVSGKVGEFSHARNGPWMPPVACDPVHGSWRSIEGEAIWVWIKEHPTIEEARHGQTVWHRFDFQLDRFNMWGNQATLTLMVDDFVDVIVNKKPVRKVFMRDDVVNLDVASYLRSGKNVVEMKIENQAVPKATASGANPTGIIYRLDVN